MSESTNQSSLSIYFSEVDGGALLTREQEQELAKTMDAAREKNQDGKRSTEQLWKKDVSPITLRKAKRAREKLITSNLRLVASVAKNFQGKGCELADLIQEGNIGLMDGIDRFDWEKGLKISTYEFLSMFRH
jgi:RNA polymerase primary sigma factor